MINGLEGIPGSGKSYEAVVYHILESVKKGRKVITNLPLNVQAFGLLDPAFLDLIDVRRLASKPLGTWDAARVDDKGNGSAFLVGDALASSTVDNGIFGGVWDFYSEWKHPDTGNGPLFVIDECHVALPVIGTDPQVVEWFKLHRHYNCDVLLVTQNFRDMNQPIARLIAMLIKVRSADILGTPGEYIRKVHAGYRGAPISTETRKYKPEFFGLYKSHSQGNSVSEASASDVKPFAVKFRRFTRVFVAITIAYCFYAGWKWYSKPIIQAPVASVSPGATAVPVVPGQPTPVVPGAVAPAAVTESQAMVPLADDARLDPYASKAIHITGFIKLGKRSVYTFVIASGSTRFHQVTSDDLAKIGYVWQPLTDCAGTLRWLKSAKSVTCDAPLISDGGSSRPVVIGLPAGASPSISEGTKFAVPRSAV